MTIPTRAAPPIPINQQQNRISATSARSAVPSHQHNKTRYTPTTDWDDQPFGDGSAWGVQMQQQQVNILTLFFNKKSF